MCMHECVLRVGICISECVVHVCCVWNICTCEGVVQVHGAYVCVVPVWCMCMCMQMSVLRTEDTGYPLLYSSLPSLKVGSLKNTWS